MRNRAEAAPGTLDSAETWGMHWSLRTADGPKAVTVDRYTSGRPEEAAREE